MAIDVTRKRAAVCLTPGGQYNDQLLYFTSPSLTADEARLFFISDRTGHPNLFVRELASGAERLLTDNADGFLKSYVYFDGNPYRGLGRASASLDVHRGIVYYLQGQQICAAGADGRRRTIAHLPAEQMTAYTHVSADGTRLCVPTTDAAALDGEHRLAGRPPYNINQRIRQQKLSSWLRVYDTQTGRELLCERVPLAWVTHVQFSPLDPEVLLYNNEWASETGEEGIRRLWLWDGRTHRSLRGAGDGRSAADYCTHEMWQRDGSSIIYHGAYATRSPEYENLQQFVGCVKADGSGLVEAPLPRSWGRYGHFTVGNRDELVTDGYYAEQDDAPLQPQGGSWIGGGAWITRLRVDWSTREIHWTPLCRHGSSWNSQDAHPHPVFNHRGDAVLFTSDATGRRAVYRVAAAG